MATKIKNSPAMMDVFDAIQANIRTGGVYHNAYVAEDRDFDTDTRLCWLTGAVGNLTQVRNDPYRDQLLDVASILFTWLQALGLSPLDIVEAIAQERSRQIQLFRDKQIGFRVDSNVVAHNRKMRVLVEELGEVAHAIDKLEEIPKAPRLQQNLITELVQTAAVTVAWLETPEVKS